MCIYVDLTFKKTITSIKSEFLTGLCNFHLQHLCSLAFSNRTKSSLERQFPANYEILRLHFGKIYPSTKQSFTETSPSNRARRTIAVRPSSSSSSCYSRAVRRQYDPNRVERLQCSTSILPESLDSFRYPLEKFR